MEARWTTVARPADPNECPHCGRRFVVEDMTWHHMSTNQCGLVSRKGRKP